MRDVVERLEPPIRAEVELVLDLVAGGTRLDVALAAWRRARRIPSLDLLVAACQLAGRDGGDLAGALEAASVSSADRLEVEDEARALATQARTSAWALAVLPCVGCAMFCLLDRDVARTLFATPLGWVCIVSGVLLNALGAGALQLMVTRALR